MRRFLLLLPLLLLSLPLLSQVKILMPVVVKDASGKPVTDLKVSDFQVSGPKSVSVANMWLVPAQTVSKEDTRTPVLVLYDAANATNPYPDLRTKWLREFLGEVAKNRLPVAFFINTVDGLQLIYAPATPPEVLSAALALVDNSKAATSDPNVEEQARKLRLLSASSRVRIFRFDARSNQLNSLLALAHLSERSSVRQALIWLADETLFPASQSSNPGGPPIPMYETTVEQLNAAHISVYPDLFSWRGFSTTDPSYYWYYAQQELAECTGGLSFANGSIWDTLQATLADFGPYYMLAVTVPAPKVTDWIPTKVKVSRPGLTVRAAPGFLGLKPLKTSKAPAAQP